MNVNLRSKPDWFLAKNPAGQVPTLEYKGTVIGESTIIADYLDDQFPGRKLNPTDPMIKAHHQFFLILFQNKVSKHFILQMISI